MQTGQTVARGPNANSSGRVGFIVYDPAGYMGVTLSWLEAADVRGPSTDAAGSARRDGHVQRRTGDRSR